MTKREARVVIDTNIWLSYMLGGLAFRQLQKILLDKHIVILISDKLKEEIIRIVRSHKFSKFFSTRQIDGLIYILTYRTMHIRVTSKVKICRDETDDFLLALCNDGNADFLITGDKIVLEIDEFHNTKIISLKNFYIQEKITDRIKYGWR